MIFLENTREFPDIIISAGARFWLRFCLSVLALVILLVSDPEKVPCQGRALYGPMPVKTETFREL